MMNGKEAQTAENRQQRIANQIESLLDRFYKDEKAYSKGQFHKNEVFFRTDYALVVLNKNNDVLISFADHTRPSYAALLTLLMDEIEDTNLLICEDYETDQYGSMVFNEIDGSSTGAIIWEEKERYYNMLKKQVKKIVIRKNKRKNS